MTAECVAEAQAISDSEAKIQWLALAGRWQSLADKLEKSEARNDPKQGTGLGMDQNLFARARSASAPSLSRR